MKMIIQIKLLRKNCYMKLGNWTQNVSEQNSVLYESQLETFVSYHIEINYKKKKGTWEKELNSHFFEPHLIKITTGLSNSKLQNFHTQKKSEYSESHTAKSLARKSNTTHRQHLEFKRYKENSTSFTEL